MHGLGIDARIVDGDDFETLRFPSDEIRLRVTDAGPVQVVEYTSEDRDGGPPHAHPWDEVEYVVDGDVEFFVRGRWVRGGPGTVQMLPAGEPHSVRVPKGRARVVMVTIGAPYDGFGRDLAALFARGAPTSDAVIEVAARHGVHPATG